MATTGSSSNFARLTAEGLIAGSGKLDPAFFEVVEGLSEEEVATLLSIKNRLDAVAGGVDVTDWKFMVPF
jgi:hypothetical protein